MIRFRRKATKNSNSELKTQDELVTLDKDKDFVKMKEKNMNK